MPDTAPVWWTDLYSPHHTDTLAARPVAGGGRLPPPGQTVDLGKPPAAEPVESVVDVEPYPVVPEPRTQQPESDLDMAYDDEPVVEDTAAWEPVPPVHSIPAVDRAINERVARVQQRVAALPGRTRWLWYNASAGFAGYYMHLVPWFGTALTECQTASGGDQVSAVILGVTACGLIAWRWDYRTRHWRGPLPWLARIPLASAVLALGLYAPGH